MSNVVYPDWRYITMLNGNIRWMMKEDPQKYLISTRKEKELLHEYIKMYGRNT